MRDGKQVLPPGGEACTGGSGGALAGNLLVNVIPWPASLIIL